MHGHRGPSCRAPHSVGTPLDEELWGTARWLSFHRYRQGLCRTMVAYVLKVTHGR